MNTLNTIKTLIRLSCVLGVAVIVVVVFSHRVDAATLFFSADNNEVSRDELFTLTLMLDPEGDSINALEGVIVFSKDVLRVERIETGRSFVPLWIDRPYVVDNEIRFAGVIPGGFEGMVVPPTSTVRHPGEVLKIRFHAHTPGTAHVSLSSARALLHDGAGTPIPVVRRDVLISVEEGSVFDRFPARGLFEEYDLTPPIHFQIERVQHDDLFSGKVAILFSTQDKGSGIAYYEVREGFRPWERAESPYVLKDQTLRSSVWVRAVDQAGNMREAFLPPEVPRRSVPGSVLLIATFLFLLGYLLFVRKWEK